MKKLITFFISMLIIISINAQTLSNWTIATGFITIEQETGATYVSEGTYAAKCTWTSSSNQDAYSEAFAVTADASFTYSLDVYDNTNAGRVTMAIAWGDGTNLYSEVYSEDNAAIQTVTITGTVPAGVTTAQIKLRFYDESAGWAGNGNTATVWVDNANYNEGGSNLIVDGGFENWDAAPTSPVITNISATPWSPTSSESVTISADIEDDVAVASASLSWGLSTGVYDQGTIVMNVGTAPNYAAVSAIPAQANGTTVYYIIAAVDGDANTTTSDEQTYTVVDPVNHTISEIQTPTDISVSDASPYVGVKVTTTGIVYAALSSGYYIQDGDGAWNGILVYDNVNIPTVGDEVTVSGFVKEYYNLTELSPVTAYAVNSSGNTLPSATVLSTADANNEDYEGVFVKVGGATCTNADAGYGQWKVNDDSGLLTIDDDMYSFTPNLNVKYNISGPMSYSWGKAVLLPRDADDIQDATSVESIRELGISIYPNPSNGIFTVNVENNFNLEVFDITGKVIKTRTLTGNTTIELNTAGVYFLRFSNENNSVTERVIVQ